MSGITSFNKKHINVEQQILIWRNDPVQAALDIMGADDPDFDLDMPQRQILRSRWRHSFEIDILTRGAGKTWLNGLTAWLQAMLYPGQRVGLLAPSFRQSKMIWSELEKFYELSPLIRECCEKPPSAGTDKCFVKLKAAPGRIGSIIEALPMGTDGAKIRGARYYYVIADELAQIDPNILDIVVQGFMATSQNPMKKAKMQQRLLGQLERGEITLEQYKMATAGGNKFVGSSTAFYQYNHLWRRVAEVIEDVHGEKSRLMRKGEPHEHLVVKGSPLNDGQIPARYMSDGKQALCAFAWYDMMPGFMDADTIERQKNKMSDYLFRMEYGCYFPPDSEGFFRRSLLDRARAHNQFGPVMAPRRGMHYVLGIDPARNGDNFAMALGEVDVDTRTVRLARMFAWNNLPFPESHSRIREVVQQFGVKLIKMDSGGGGQTIRDLMADSRYCNGMRPILEQGNQQHLGKSGDPILAPLVQFANYDWLLNANEGLKSALDHNQFLIAATPPVPGEIWTPAAEDADAEIEATLGEMSSIITIPVGGRIRWDVPTKSQRKDRYSATLIMYDAGRELLAKYDTPTELATGFWS